MVSLTMMARLLEAVRTDARLVLVGDPDQLASVEAGAVLGDLARAPGRPEPHLDAALHAVGLPGGVVNGVVTLQHVWRFRGAVAAFAAAVQTGDADTAVALLRKAPNDLAFAESDTAAAPDALRVDVVDTATALATAARANDVPAALVALDRHRVLCGHRRGPFGVARWSREIERWLADALPDLTAHGEWYPGRPVLVTANDHEAGLYNGDTGVVVATPDGPRVAFPGRGHAGRARPPDRRGHRARHDRAPRPGQPVRTGDGGTAARRVPAAHPGAAVHRRHEGTAVRAGGRIGGSRARPWRGR